MSRNLNPIIHSPKKGLTQTSGDVLGAMVDSTLPGDGIAPKELAYYASISAGSSLLFEPLTLPVPASVAGKLLLSASVSSPLFDLSSSAVSGLGLFQRMLEEAAVSSAPYSVNVVPGLQVYDQNTPVTLSGEARAASGELLAGTSVQIEVSGRGYPRALSGFTDSQGRYSVDFNPMPGEAGIYTLAAFPPEAIDHAVKSTFSIVGFAFEPASYGGAMSQNSDIELTLAVKNTGETPLKGLTWAAETLSGAGVSLLPGASVLPAALGAGTRVSFNLKAHAAADASPQAELKLTVTDSHGFSRALPISLSVIPAMPIPAATPAQFQTGLLAGETKTQTILLQNKGFNTWSDVSVNIAPEFASWVKIKGSPLIGDMAPGGSASLVLSLTPLPDFTSDTYAGAHMVEVRSANAAALFISGLIAVTTARTGSASVTVVNGDIAIGEAGEFISGAEVTVKSMDVPDLSFTLKTGLDGKALFLDIPAGNYTYKASYAGFQELTGRFTIDPGVTRAVEAVLITSMVTYSWSVTPTTIQDYYEIKLDMTFNTSVNAPALVAEPAFIELNEPAGTTIYRQYTLTNKGLVSVFDVEVINADDGSGIRVEAPFTSIPELKPGQSVVVPLKIYIVHTSCEKIKQYIKYKYTCARGTETTVWKSVLDIINGGIEKMCNTLKSALGVAGLSESCVYDPEIVGPDILGPSATTYYIVPDPSENKCPSCDALKCSDFVWSSAGDVHIVGSNAGCSISANAPNSGVGSLSATFAGSKQINPITCGPCKVMTANGCAVLSGGICRRDDIGWGDSCQRGQCSASGSCDIVFEPEDKKCGEYDNINLCRKKVCRTGTCTVVDKDRAEKLILNRNVTFQQLTTVCHSPGQRPDYPKQLDGCTDVPDETPIPVECAFLYRDQFTEKCNNHDVGYQSCTRPQETSDWQLQVDMMSVCSKMPAGICKNACVNTASNYYWKLSALGFGGGTQPYQDRQKEYCDCCPTN